jgi:glycosyltransferase involved in cell wall biosynthesis
MFETELGVLGSAAADVSQSRGLRITTSPSRWSSNVLRVAAFTASKSYASARFRVRQLIPILKQNGVGVREFIAPIYKHLNPGLTNPALLRMIRYARPISLVPQVLASHAYSASWIQREFIWSRDSLERFTARPRLFDVDDAIWLDREGAAQSIARLAERMDVIVAGNRTIAEWFGQYARDVRIVHTAIDTTRFKPAPRRAQRPYTLVWTGQAFTLKHLYVIEPALERFFAQHADAELVVVCDTPPQFRSLRADRVRFVRWSPEVEVAAIQGGDIGLMPLVDDEHSRAKCSFKMLQFMACEIPVVVSPVGLNTEILDLGRVGYGALGMDDWFRAFQSLREERELAAAMGREGRRLACERFGHDVIGGQLSQIFKEVCGAPSSGSSLGSA